jgi:peptidoglycan/LPS O-acetylase OafA/YrhL
VAKEQSRRPHVYEIDPLRAFTALSVVGVHVLTNTAFLNQTQTGVQIQYALAVSLHYTREVFIFITAFALTYIYFGRPFSLGRFWLKRGLGVVFPYVIWSLIYIWANHPGITWGTFFQQALIDLPTGQASYQLYYILLSIEFYMLLPLFLPLLQYCKRHPWIVLSISGALQLVLFYVDFHLLQAPDGPKSGLWYFVAKYQDSFILVYQFYFILGGYVALYFQEVRSFLLRHGKLITGMFLLAVIAVFVYNTIQIDVFHMNIGYASTVLQPIMVPYCAAFIFFVLWLTSRWANKVSQGQRSRSYYIWHTLADAAFGIYLVHVLILNELMRYLVLALPKTWLVAVRVLIMYVLTAGGATIFSVVMLHIPLASRLVGRAERRMDFPFVHKLKKYYSFVARSLPGR